jgi:hypothetical protein
VDRRQHREHVSGEQDAARERERPDDGAGQPVRWINDGSLQEKLPASRQYRNIRETFALLNTSGRRMADWEEQMNKKLVAIGVISAGALLASGWLLGRATGEGLRGFGPPFMHGGMGPRMGGHMGPPGMMGMGHDAATMGQMRVIHELFANHERIRRSVTNLPDGIRTVTESDDPRIAELLKEHVASMRRRVDAGDDPHLPIESRALRSIFENYRKIRTTVETTEKGMIVVQTSEDSKVVADLQQHASEVTDFVRDGMLAMRQAMMKNMGGMMHGPMGHGMMHGR